MNGADMSDLIKTLKSFNRKERFFLLRNALGKQDFKLSEKFRRALSKSAGSPQIPDNAFVAIDYHLDWLYASLFLACCKPEEEQPYCNEIRVSTGTQQDIDLLVAFKTENTHHLILVEAKGYGSWDNKQLERKTERLCKIFGNDGKKYDSDVKPYICITSPECPKKIKTDKWPEWMMNKNGKPKWFKLCLPGERRTVIGTDAKKRHGFYIRKQQYFKGN